MTPAPDDPRWTRCEAAWINRGDYVRLMIRGQQHTLTVSTRRTVSRGVTLTLVPTTVAAAGAVTGVAMTVGLFDPLDVIPVQDTVGAGAR